MKSITTITKWHETHSRYVQIRHFDDTVFIFHDLITDRYRLMYHCTEVQHNEPEVVQYEVKNLTIEDADKCLNVSLEHFKLAATRKVI